MLEQSLRPRPCPCLQVWDARALKESGRVGAAHLAAARDVSFAPQQQHLAVTCGDDAKLRLWDLRCAAAVPHLGCWHMHSPRPWDSPWPPSSVQASSSRSAAWAAAHAPLRRRAWWVTVATAAAHAQVAAAEEVLEQPWPPTILCSSGSLQGSSGSWKYGYKSTRQHSCYCMQTFSAEPLTPASGVV